MTLSAFSTPLLHYLGRFSMLRCAVALVAFLVGCQPGNPNPSSVCDQCTAVDLESACADCSGSQPTVGQDIPGSSTLWLTAVDQCSRYRQDARYQCTGQCLDCNRVNALSAQNIYLAYIQRLGPSPTPTPTPIPTPAPVPTLPAPRCKIPVATLTFCGGVSLDLVTCCDNTCCPRLFPYKGCNHECYQTDAEAGKSCDVYSACTVCGHGCQGGQPMGCPCTNPAAPYMCQGVNGCQAQPSGGITVCNRCIP